MTDEYERLREHRDELMTTTYGQLPSVAVVLNGPPGIGKDTIAAEFLLRNPKYQHLEFKAALYTATAEFFDVPLQAFKRNATHRIWKEIGWHWWAEEDRVLSPREMLIHVSENVCKPKFGNDYFGRRAAEDAIERGAHWIITDGGFQEEVGALNEHFDIVSIVRLHGDWADFSKDSRDYIYGDTELDKDVTLVHGDVAQGVMAVDCHALALETGQWQNVRR